MVNLDLNSHRNGPLLLKVREAQALLNIGHTKFYELVEAGHIPLIKIGRSSFVKPSSIIEFVESLTPPQAK